MARWVRTTDEGHRVTTLELFFDLVFVFAFTQVTALVADDLSWRGVVRGILLLAIVWWAWVAYSWLGNHAHADEGVVRGGMIVAIAAIFIAGLSIPGAWKEQHEALVLAGAISVVRVAHIVTYWFAAADDKVVQRQILRLAFAVCTSAVMLVIGAFLGGPAQTLVWFSALVVDYAGVYFGGSNWRLPSAAHFAERHGLIVIVALGESFVAVGVGASEAATTVPVIIAALLGILISLSLWWTYFDVTALYAERVLASKQGIERVRMAKDSYSYLHFPMIAGIIFLAVGLKKVLSYVAKDDTHTLAGVPLYSLFGGICVFLLAIVAFRYRNVRSLSIPRVVAAAVCLAMIPVAAQIPPLGAVALAAAVLVGLISFEAIRYASTRAELHSKASE